MVTEVETTDPLVLPKAVGEASDPASVIPSKTPDQLVEEKILTRFEKEKLLDAQGLKAIRTRLATGGLTPQDWNLAFENTLERRQRHE